VSKEKERKRSESPSAVRSSAHLSPARGLAAHHNLIADPKIKGG